MLTITIPAVDMFDEASQEFIQSDETILQLEHSLVSISKWESEFEKPFLSGDDKTTAETLGYIRHMTLTEGVDQTVYSRLTKKETDIVSEYINAKMTATTFKDLPGAKGRGASNEFVTAELVYYWMVSLQIPFECQYWHFNRLTTLIKVCNLKNQPPKKMSRREAMNQHRSLNAQRRAGSGM